MSIAIHGEDLVRSINRTAMLKMYAHITNQYHKFAILSARITKMSKDKTEYGPRVYSEKLSSFLNDLTRDVKMFCGDDFKNGLDPNGITHSMGMANSWFYGRPIMEMICKGFPQCVRKARIVFDRCRNAGIKINVPPEDLKILESVR